MITAVDATMLMLLVRPESVGPDDPITKRPVERLGERLDYLIQELEAQNAQIVVPTPSLSEVLVDAGDAGPGIVSYLETTSPFKIAEFGVRAAIEVAARIHDAKLAGDKRGGVTGAWAKIKFDRQIVAIAVVEGATRIYSDDDGVAAFASKIGLQIVRTWELPLPPTNPQGALELPPPPPKTEPSHADDETEPDAE